jgi:hypothetical protein
MFRRLVDSLKRLMRRPPPDHPGLTGMERRVWVRQACDLETSLQPAAGAGGRCLARVRDVSLGGLQLTVNRRFEAGSLLCVDLPGDRSATSVLAYVVRVQAAGPSEWSLGCTFALELSEEDLERFGAKRVKPAGQDRRTWERFLCSAEAAYQLLRPVEARSGIARVLDISAGGIRLRLNRPMDVGTLLTLELRALTGPQKLTVIASVVRMTAHGGREWTFSCKFLRELTDQELAAFV